MLHLIKFKPRCLFSRVFPFKFYCICIVHTSRTKSSERNVVTMQTALYIGKSWRFFIPLTASGISVVYHSRTISWQVFTFCNAFRWCIRVYHARDIILWYIGIHRREPFIVITSSTIRIKWICKTIMRRNIRKRIIVLWNRCMRMCYKSK